MMLSSTTPFTPRPRPPRTRSSQTSTKTSVDTPSRSPDPASLAVPSGLAIGVDTVAAQELLHVGTAPTLSGSMQPTRVATPPAAGPEQEQHRQDGSKAGVDSHVRVHTSEELQAMLEEAHRVIQERERDLGIAASIGKSLLDSNNALRAKQDALGHRVSSSSSPNKGSPVTAKDSGAPIRTLGIPSYGAKGEYIESRPPPSPRHSLASRRVSRPSSAGEDDWVDEEEENVFRHQSVTPSPKKHQLRYPGLSNGSTMPSNLRDGHHRQRNSSISSVSSILITGPSAPNSVTASRSNSEKNLASHLLALSTPTQLQQQHAQLSDQNAELERQLHELENELNQADATGKKKLRRLDKELGSLRRELEAALDRNKALEERLSSAKSSSSSTAAVRQDGGVHRWQRSLQDPDTDIVNDNWLEGVLRKREYQPTDTDTDHDVECHSEVTATLDASSNLPSHASMPFAPRASRNGGISSNMADSASPPAPDAEPRTNKEAELIAKLMSKIAELQSTNTAMSESRAETDSRLEKASRDLQVMQQQYELLEEKVFDAEVKEREYERALGWNDKRAAIEWRQDGEKTQQASPAHLSPYSSLRRKALGNQPLIEKHRRMASGSGSPAWRTSYLYPDNASQTSSLANTPQQARRPSDRPGLTRSVSASSHLSAPYPHDKRSLSRSTSRSSSFFEPDLTNEDILEAMKRRNDRDRAKLEQADSLFLQRNASSSDVATEDGRQGDGFDEDSGFSRAAYPKMGFKGSTSVSDISDYSISPSASLRALGHNKHTLASELDGLWDNAVSLHSREATDQTLHPATESRIVRTAGRAASAYGDESNDDHGEETASEDDTGPMRGGAPDAETYEALERALADIPISWADDEGKLGARPRLLRDVPHGQEPSGVKQAHTHQGSLHWAYDDSEDSNEENDPWRDEGKGPLQVESREMVEMREQAEQRASKRRLRLIELAKELNKEVEEEDIEEGLRRRMIALRCLGDEDEDVALTPKAFGHDFDDFEQIETPRLTGTDRLDYYPVSRTARYHPSMVATRIKTTSQGYLQAWLLWTRFLTVLAVAVAFSLWRGPKESLGLRRLPHKKSMDLTRAVSPAKRYRTKTT